MTADGSGPAMTIPSWTLAELAEEALETLRRGEYGDGSVIDGRALAVKASPMRSNSTKLVVGTACLPPGFSTRPHSHEAEEVAVILAGSGRVDIDGIPHPLETGTVLLTPSNRVHVTHSDPGDDPLVVLWFYAPPGSEARWVEPDQHDTAGPAG